jgi:uncharacterized membrane protein
MAHWLQRLVKHRLFDERDAHRALSEAALQRIGARVAESETRHSGQIRVMVEAGLPLGYLRQHLRPRDRAITMFGKLRVWDTERNNGVLIYLLLAERAIEIVADRGVNRHADAAAWAEIAERMRSAFQGGDFEAGLSRAIDAVEVILVRHFPAVPGEVRDNELPDAPYVR